MGGEGSREGRDFGVKSRLFSSWEATKGGGNDVASGVEWVRGQG